MCRRGAQPRSIRWWRCATNERGPRRAHCSRKEMVGERSFEPPTSWSRTKSGPKSKRFICRRLGAREPFLFSPQLPADTAGVNYLATPIFSADEKSYVFGYRRILSDLFVVDQL